MKKVSREEVERVARIYYQNKDASAALGISLRYFARLSLEETAAVLEVSVPSVTRRGNYARAWLRREL